jgi:hypothetical protein
MNPRQSNSNSAHKTVQLLVFAVAVLAFANANVLAEFLPPGNHIIAIKQGAGGGAPSFTCRLAPPRGEGFPWFSTFTAEAGTQPTSKSIR